MPRKRPIRFAEGSTSESGYAEGSTSESAVPEAADAVTPDDDLDEVPHPEPAAVLPDPEPARLRTFREWVGDRTQRGGFDLLDSRLPVDRVRCEVELERRLFLAWEAAREGVV